MSARTQGFTRYLRNLVSTLQRAGHSSPKFPKGPVFTPLTDTRVSRRRLRDLKHKFNLFVESGKESIERAYGPSSDKTTTDNFLFSDFFFPEDLEPLGGFSHQNGNSNFVKSNLDNHKRGQGSVNTKSTPSSWEDDFEESLLKFPSDYARPDLLQTPILAAFDHWGSETGTSSLALGKIALNRDLFRGGVISEWQWASAHKKLHKLDNDRLKLLQSIARLDDYIESEKDPRTFEQQVSSVLNTTIRSVTDTPGKWTKAVNLMRDARALKELLLQAKTKNVELLDKLDLKEERALSVLNGNFQFMIGATSTPTPKLFDKNEFDAYMESVFGSINQPSSVKIDLGDARQIFSMYLARKVWCLQPWRKYMTATESFYNRVLTKIEADVDRRALNIAREVMKHLLDGDETEARSFEPAPEAACLERSKLEGGKRFAYLSRALPIRSHVKPVSVYTGGKIRTITKDSVAYVKYNWINKFLGSQFRKLNCSIFGGDVQEWWDKIGGLEKAEGEYFCSGDLESATDLFDGRITESLIDMIGERFSMLKSEIEEMKGFTTRAFFSRNRDPKKRQKRGQLMGSVISFPILCVLSLTAYLYGHEGVHQLFDERKGKSFLFGLKSVGINGDDVVFAGNLRRIERWTMGVKAVGGVVSRGKTLVNENYFTVNSELWTATGKVNCARPSILTALTGDNKYFISPQFEWKEYLDCEILNLKSRRIFDLERKLKVNVPTCLGGLGLVKKFDPSSMLEAYERRELERRFSPVFLSNEAFLKEQKDIRENLSFYGPRVECWISKDMDDAFKRVYTSKRFNFRLKPHEIKFSLEKMLTNPCPDYLERSRKMFENIEFPVLEDLKKHILFDREKILKSLHDNYSAMMSGWKERRIPVSLLRAYQAKMSTDQLGHFVADVESILKDGRELPTYLSNKPCVSFDPFSLKREIANINTHHVQDPLWIEHMAVLGKYDVGHE